MVQSFDIMFEWSSIFILITNKYNFFIVLKDTESLDVVVRHQPEKEILGNGNGAEIASRSKGRKFVIQHVTGGANGNVDGLLDGSICGAATKYCVIQ
jgi:hypothetical protein